MQQRLRQARELDALAAASSMEEATFWRWIESAAKDEEEQEGQAGAQARGVAGGGGDWAPLDAQVRGMITMLAQLEASTSQLFSLGAVRPADLGAIATRTRREVGDSGIIAGSAAAATGGEKVGEVDWAFRHPAYASLVALYADAQPRSVGGALAALREGHAGALDQAARACAAAGCPFEFVFGSDVVRLSKVTRG